MRHVTRLRRSQRDQRVPEEDERRCRCAALSDEVTTNPAPHRLADNRDPVDTLPEPGVSGGVTFEQPRQPIRRSASRFHIRVVEREGRDSVGGETTAQPTHERMALAGTRPVSEENPHRRLAGTAQQPGHLGARRPLDAQTSRHLIKVAPTAPDGASPSPYHRRTMRVEILEDPEALAVAAADEIAGWFDRPDHHTLGLAGGSTPRRTYEVLAGSQVDWGRVDVWLTDERHVPIGHPDSNAAMVIDALIDHVPARFHHVRYDEDTEAAAAAYQRELDDMWAGNPGRGLMVLGVGGDGHTASLFPGTAALEDDEPGYVANWVPSMDAWRLTATLPLLAAAERTVFLVSGSAKAEVVADIIQRGSDHPASIVSRAAPDAVWLLDAAAASLLD